MKREAAAPTPLRLQTANGPSVACFPGDGFNARPGTLNIFLQSTFQGVLRSSGCKLFLSFFAIESTKEPGLRPTAAKHELSDWSAHSSTCRCRQSRGPGAINAGEPHH